MRGEMGAFVELSLLSSIVSLNYFFLRMWHILHGKWWRFSPTWRWPQDIAKLKQLAKTAESEKLRQECNTILWGLYVTVGYMLLVAVLGFILSRMRYYSYP
jgi:hypothetical protein